MADPQHTPTLDGFDRLTVRLYRLGHGISGLGFVSLALCLLLGSGQWPAIAGILVGASLCAGNLHLYDKRIRWLVQAVVLLGLLLTTFGAAAGVLMLAQAGLGFCLVASSILAFKEWFCFRIPGLRLMPILLAAGVLSLAAGGWMVSQILFAIAGLVQLWLALKKTQMPLGHDIGDRAHYQI